MEGFINIAKPAGPDFRTQGINLVKSIPELINDRFRKVPDHIYELRLELCFSCHLWDEKGNFGMGKCNHKKCGCTKQKHKFASQRCPLGKWGKYEGVSNG